MKFENDDILLFKNGKMAQIIEKSVRGMEKSSSLLFIDEEGFSYKEIKNVDILENLGHSPGVLCNFCSTRSIHLRLNQLSKV